MRDTHISTPELGLIAGTRAALGFGMGLLLADRFSTEQRQAIGWTLVAVGALTTVPLAFEVFGRPRRIHHRDGRHTSQQSQRDPVSHQFG
jgi:hypothetical protein